MDKIENLIESVKKLDITKTIKEKAKQKLSAKQQLPWTRSNLKTGLIYDDFMAKHKCLWTKSDECPERYECVRDRIKHYNLDKECQIFEPQMGTEEQILLCHDKTYHDLVKSTKGEQDLEKLKKISEKYDGIYFNEYTYDCAMLAAGCSIRLADAILNDEIRNGFAVVRTPGHHAQKAVANGFCFFNNAAIVAKHCLESRGLNRVLIIDWDVHHGQGTQSFYYDNPNVLYVSIHRYENGKYWPNLIESNFNFTGLKAGKGYNINLPLNEPGCNDADFLLMWFNVIMPVAYQFNPELVIISAGFDAAIGCPEGCMRVKPVTYHILCHSLMALANGRVLSLLEGGYNLLSLAESAAMTLRCLLSYPCPPILDTDRFIELQPHNVVIKTILDAIWAIRPQWSYMNLQGEYKRFRTKEESVGGAGGDVDQRPRYAPVAVCEGASSFAEQGPEKYDLEGVSCVKDEERQAKLNEEIKQLIDKVDLSTAERTFEQRTLLLFDDKMMGHRCADKSHPEKPDRYKRIKERLHTTGLFDRCYKINQAGKESRKATEEELLLAHDQSLIDTLKKTPQMSDAELTKLGNKMESIYINQSTYESALLAAGAALEAVDQVLQRKCSNAFALIRPPGHHASRDTASGFCFLNNVVVAARYAQHKYPEHSKRILMIDYDFHHGNGVQRMVQDDESILYISLHGFNDANEYPFEQLSNYTTGSKNIINIPWNDDRMGDPEYMMAFLNIIMPVAYEFNPDLVLVSSGFDAANKDPLGRYKISPAAFGHFIHHLLPLAGGKLIACLEGGYNLDVIAECSAYVVSALLGDPPQALPLNGRSISLSALLTMRNVISYHKTNYKMLCLDYDLPSDEVE